MRPTWKQCMAAIVSTATAVVVLVQAFEFVLTKVDRLTNAIEAEQMGPGTVEEWRQDVDAKIDSLESYHVELEDNRR